MSRTTAGRSPSPRRLPAASRSRTTNGALLVDGNTAKGRRCRDLLRALEELASEYGELTPLKQAIARRAALIGVLIEDAEVKLSNGVQFDADVLVRMVGLEGRLIERLTTRARRRAGSPFASDQGPDLESYLAERGLDMNPEASAGDPGDDPADAGDPGSGEPDDGDELADREPADFIPTDEEGDDDAA